VIIPKFWEPRWCFPAILLPRPLGSFLREALIKKGGTRMMTPMWQRLCKKRMMIKLVIKRLSSII